MKTSYWSVILDEMRMVEFYHSRNHMKTSYWSVILDEMLGLAEFRHTNDLYENELLE